jgi:N6-L-threonylcarbamoyladenine synthase
MDNGILGIDTSCYTTSLAIVNELGVICTDQRQILTVPLGDKGLRQGDAVFKHLGNLPDLAKKIRREFSGQLVAVAATERPRPIFNSYLPVFKAGYTFGKSLAYILGVPFYSFSHQENHLQMARWAANGPRGGKFIALHLSGGTTEILLVNVWIDWEFSWGFLSQRAPPWRN